MRAPSASTIRSSGSSRRSVGAVHVAVHTHHRRADRLELAEHLEGREVACVKEQVGARDPLDACIRQPPAPRGRCVSEMTAISIPDYTELFPRP